MHEVIVPDRTDCVGEFCEGLEVSHHPDKEKSREQYNQMIEDSYHEYKDARYHIYQAQQLLVFDRLDEAKIVIKSLLRLKDASKTDKALAYRLLGLMSEKLRLWYFAKSVMSFPTRETYTSLAAHYYGKSKWFRTYYFGKKADSIKIKTSSILKDLSVWSFFPTNLMLVGKHNMKLSKLSRSYKVNKKEINPNSMISYKFKLFND